MQATFNRYLKDKLRTNFTDASPKDQTDRCPAGYGHYSIIRRKSDVDKLKGLSKEARKEVLSKPLNTEVAKIVFEGWKADMLETAKEQEGWWRPCDIK